MLFTINEGDVVAPVDMPHKVGVVHSWSSNGDHTLVAVKFHGSNLQENFSSRSLKQVAPFKPKTTKGQFWGMAFVLLLTIVGAGVLVEYLVTRPLGLSGTSDWLVTGAVWMFIWYPIEARFRNRGRTRIKNRRQPAVKAAGK